MNIQSYRALSFFVPLIWATCLPAQEVSSQIVSRTSIATTTNRTENTVDAPRASRTSFPSLTPSRSNREADSNETLAADGLAGPAITVTSSLVVVLALFAGLVWVTRKVGSRGLNRNGAVPKEVLQSLGSAPIDARTRITLVRCGARILVMAETPSGVHPLSEITDPDEVRELSAACLGDAKQAFASALSSMEREKTQDGFVGTPTGPSSARAHGTASKQVAPAEAPRNRGRLFATA